MTSSEPSYHMESTSGYSVVTLAAALSKEQWGDIESVGNELVERLNDLKTPALLVDLTAMEYIGSSTVALVVRLWKTVQKNGGQLAVINKHPVVLEVLQIAGLKKVWTIVNTREEALAELGVGKRSVGVMLTLAGVIVAAVAIAGLVIQLSPQLNVKREVTLGLLFGGAGLGLLLGLINTIRDKGGRRTVSALALLACLAVGTVGGLKAAGILDGRKQETSPEAGENEEKSSDESKTDDAKAEEDQQPPVKDGVETSYLAPTRLFDHRQRATLRQPRYAV